MLRAAGGGWGGVQWGESLLVQEVRPCGRVHVSHSKVCLIICLAN